MALFQVCDHRGCAPHPVHYSGDDLREAVAVFFRLMDQEDDNVDPYLGDEEGILLGFLDMVSESEEDADLSEDDAYRICLERKASRQERNEDISPA